MTEKTRFSENFEVLQEGTMAMLELWMSNFARNVQEILVGNSVRLLNSEMVSSGKSHQNLSNSALVVGAGPSINEKNHLDKLSDSNYSGAIVCTDRMLIPCLKKGITPDKFPDFYVVTIDPLDKIANFYDDPILNEFGHKINAILSTCSSPQVLKKCTEYNLQKYYFHPLIDDYRKISSINKMINLMSKSDKNPKGFPGMQTGGNVGSSCWVFSWAILGKPIVGLIGINFGYLEDTKITDTQHINELINAMGDEKSARRLYKKVFNPYYECQVLLDPVFDYYREAFCDLVTRTPKWVRTINATEGGSLFGERIEQTTLESFLNGFS